MSIRVLCYGDSNTWGYTPGTGIRLDENTRWTQRLQALLGEEFTIIEAGLNGRTTVYDDPVTPYRNGLKGLGYTMMEAKPIDLVVLCLGTNDLLYYPKAIWAQRGIDELVRTLCHANEIYGGSTPVFRTNPRILLMSPITLHPDYEALRPETRISGHAAEAERFSSLYQAVAKKYGIWFLDAALYANASMIDCVHMEPESHEPLAAALADKIQSICREERLTQSLEEERYASD